MNLIITGGGTGGHIFAGVALADEFKSQSKANKVLFVGSSQGLETRLVSKHGYELVTLDLGKLVGQTLLQRIKTLFQITLAVFKAYKTIKNFKADMVIGVGGYAAGPCILAAKLACVPIGVLEQNSVMGFTNRISAKLANYVFLAFPEIPKGIDSKKCIYTGNPARTSMKPRVTKPQKPFVVFSFGGSQGAGGINKMMVEAAKELLPLKDEFQFFHQTGEKELESVQQKYKEIGFEAQTFAFIDNMQEMYDRASIVVCRAGSGTISELGATQNASILIPFPFAAQNHQEVNARMVEEKGGAIVLLQTKNLDEQGKVLAECLKNLKDNPKRLETMRKSAASFFHADAAKKIIDQMKTYSLTLH